MSETATAVIILAAGMGTRMRSDVPKVLHKVAGRSLVEHVLATVDAVEPKPARRIVVASPDNRAALKAALPDAELAVQDKPLGTGNAVSAAGPLLADFDGKILVIFGDTPLVLPGTVASLLQMVGPAPAPAVAVAGFRPDDPSGYGRLQVDKAGSLTGIIEARECNAEQLRNNLCNGGFMAFDGSAMFEFIDEISNDNAKGEFYLTDSVAIAASHGRSAAVLECDEAETLGVDDRRKLAQAEALMQERLRISVMAKGVTLIDPATVWLSHDTVIGADVTVEPNVWFGPGVEISNGVEIRAFSHLEGCKIDTGAVVGPYARLRPGSDIGPSARIGNFVEVKNAKVEAGAKANHLSYLGDARIGAGANIGAGTITCNYDGFLKSTTDIGVGAFIGSNSALVAPVKIGDGVIVGAGSTITDDIEANALSVARSRQTTKPGLASAFRERKAIEKTAGPAPGTATQTAAATSPAKKNSNS